MTGFTVSDLNIPGFQQEWEKGKISHPSHLASPLEIMIQGPLGGAAFNNEYGRPNLTGYFRTFLQQQEVDGQMEWKGYFKPIMIAGGMGTVRPMHTHKKTIPPGALLIVLGGPGMLIGLGGGAASSMASGSSSIELDFASVQRENPEMQRRAQMVIDMCTSLGNDNPIISIHDVGAGGLSNALPEIVHDSDLGANIDIRKILVDDHTMSPMEIWCNESQERYVLCILKENLGVFHEISTRERCLYSVVGTTTEEKRLLVTDSLFHNNVIDIDMDLLFGNTPRMHRLTTRAVNSNPPFILPEGQTFAKCLNRVLALPTVASKSFLITIGDRTVTGSVARDQMVGRWQVPVSDVSVVLADYFGYSGQAMAMGERSPIALLNPAASAKMAVGEALTNIAAAGITALDRVRLSANWMASADHPHEGAALYDAVQAIGLDMCPALGIAIPVGKDSMSMKTKWEADGKSNLVSSPVSLVITAYAPVNDARRVLTPELRTEISSTSLIFIDLAGGKKRLGGSCIAQVYGQLGHDTPNVENYEWIKSFFKALGKLSEPSSDRPFGTILAYHDRSDGGLIVTILEMCFAGHAGCTINIDTIAENSSNLIPALFNEELGAVIQVRDCDIDYVVSVFDTCGFPRENLHNLGCVTRSGSIQLKQKDQLIFSDSRTKLHRRWNETSFKIQSIRDNGDCALEEFNSILDDSDPGLFVDLKFDFIPELSPIQLSKRPKVAILREQGINSYLEMAFAFDTVGFEVVDVHMTDIISGSVSLSPFVGLACPGGFSYGDVLGAGVGWANSKNEIFFNCIGILLNKTARKEFQDFFIRRETFTLGICNGCQMLSYLKEIIPGASHWPSFVKNVSSRFEARVCMVEVCKSPSLFLEGMSGSQLPVVVAHGEGQAVFEKVEDLEALVNPKNSTMSIRFIDNYGSPAGRHRYPFNPNGSVLGITGICSDDGRVLAMMPHPERIVRGVTNTWGTQDERLNWYSSSPWIQIFRNAFNWTTTSI